MAAAGDSQNGGYVHVLPMSRVKNVARVEKRARTRRIPDDEWSPFPRYNAKAFFSAA